MLRLFLSIPVHEKIGIELLRLQTGLENVRYSPIENFHITLFFLGDTNEAIASEIDEAISEIKFQSFDLKLKGAGFFGGEEPYSFHILVEENRDLNLLQSKIANILKKYGILSDHKKYIPHVTLGYCKPMCLADDIIKFETQNALYSSKKWKADRFHLYSSHLGNTASVYRLEAVYPLK